MGMSNEPSVFNENHVKIGYAFGDCFVRRGGSRIPLVRLPGAEELILRDGDVIVTGGNGHVSGITCTIPEGLREERNMMVFPNSELVLRVKTINRGKTQYDLITSFELVKGLFQVSIITTGRVEDALIIPSRYPAIEFKPMMGKFGREKNVNTIIELNFDNTLTLFMGMMTIVHKASGVEAKSFDPLRPVSKPKITVTRSAIYITDMAKSPDRRVETIMKKFMELDKHSARTSLESGYKEYSAKETLDKRQDDRLKRIEQELINEECKNNPDPKVMEFLKNQLKKKPSILVSNEDKKLYDKIQEIKPDMNILESPLPAYTPISESDKVVVKDVKRTTKNYGQIVAESMEKDEEIREALLRMNKSDADLNYYKRMLSQGKSVPPEMLDLINKQKANRAALEAGVQTLGKDKGVTAQTASKDIDESLVYNKIEMHFTKVEKGTELNMSAAPPGKEYLMVYFDAVNKGSGQAFMYPDEEARLIVDGEVIPLRNYRMETNMDANKKYSGQQLFFVVPENAKDFTIEFGKKSLPKQTVRIKI